MRLIVCVLFTLLFSTGHAIGINLPGAKYTEQEYSNAVNILASQNIHREHNREKKISLTCFFNWLAGDYFSMKDQQFDEIYNPIYFKQVQEVIRSRRREYHQEQRVAKLNKILSDCHAQYEAGAYTIALDTCQTAKAELGGIADTKITSALYALTGRIHEKLGDYLNARKEYAKAILNSQDSPAKISLDRDFKRADEAFAKTFLNEDYDKRKTIMLVDNVQRIDFPEHINIFNAKTLPNIEFRDGRPVINQLYVGHPHITSQYVPLEDSQYEFLRDRIGEFFELMQALGATKVDVKNITINKQEYGLENNTKTGFHFSADLSKAVRKLGILSVFAAKVLPDENMSVSAAKTKKESSTISESAFHDLKIKQVFNPKKKPYLPKGLIWYTHEPSWQRLYRERMQGNLLQHIETLSTKNTKIMQNSELAQIGGELGRLLGGNHDKTTKQITEAQEDVELTINVSFAPLDTLR